MKKLMAVLFLNVFIGSLVHAEWRVVEAKFIAKEVTDRKNWRDSDAEHVSKKSSYYNNDEFVMNLKIVPSYSKESMFTESLHILGSINIIEYDEETLSKRETNLYDVVLELRAKGLILRYGNVEDIEIPLSHLNGKKVSSIFLSTFHGVKVGFGAGLFFGAYPNYSILVNSNGIVISNSERMLRLFDLNIGIEVGYVSMRFEPRKNYHEMNYNHDMNQVLGQ